MTYELSEIEDILRNIAEKHLPRLRRAPLWGNEICHALQAIASELLPLWRIDLIPVVVVGRLEDFAVSDKGEKDDARYVWDHRRIEFSPEFLRAHRDEPGKIVGLMVHELCHHWQRHGGAEPNGKRPRACDKRGGHNRCFMWKAIEMWRKINAALDASPKLKPIYGEIDLGLEATVRRWGKLKKLHAFIVNKVGRPTADRLAVEMTGVGEAEREEMTAVEEPRLDDIVRGSSGICWADDEDLVEAFAAI